MSREVNAFRTERTNRIRIWDETRSRLRDFNAMNLLSTIWVDPRYYEPLHHYKPKPDFLNIVMTHLPTTWRVTHINIYYSCMPAGVILPIQGWKLHVSATPTNAENILDLVTQYCISSMLPFKFVADKVLLRLINAKQWDRASSGKFITIYPLSYESFIKHIQALYGILKDFEGPYILSDRRYKDCRVLYYRYGGISPIQRLDEKGQPISFIVDPNGLPVPDIRKPIFTLPYWVRDPFVNDGPANNSREVVLNGRYRVVSAIDFSNSGGVYAGIDLHDNDRSVIIKEARPFANPVGDNIDAVTLLQKEAELLKELQDSGYVPKFIDIFKEWEHYYLVVDRLEGISLRRYGTAHCPWLANSRPRRAELASFYRKFALIARNIAEILDYLHRRDIIFADLSVNNLFITPNPLSLKIIDFGSAYRLGKHQPVNLFTPGFSRSIFKRRNTIKNWFDDYYSFGCILLWLLSPITALIEVKEEAPFAFLKYFEEQYGLPKEISTLV